MINHKSTFYLGVFVFIIPFLGFPTMWKMGLVIFAGVLLILTSLKVPASISLSKRVLKREQKKEKIELPQIETEEIKQEIVSPIPVNPPITIITPSAKKVTNKVRAKFDSVRKKAKEL